MRTALKDPKEPQGPGRLTAPTLLLIVVAVAAGCNRGPEYGEVEGTLTLHGKPLSDVEIEFLPEPEQGSNGPRAAAATDAQGHYRLKTSRARREGVVVGKYRVCVTDLSALPPLPLPGGPEAPSVASPAGGHTPQAAASREARVPPQYGRPTETPLRGVEVRAGKQTYDFDLGSELVRTQ